MDDNIELRFIAAARGQVDAVFLINAAVGEDDSFSRGLMAHNIRCGYDVPSPTNIGPGAVFLELKVEDGPPVVYIGGTQLAWPNPGGATPRKKAEVKRDMRTHIRNQMVLVPGPETEQRTMLINFMAQNARRRWEAAEGRRMARIDPGPFIQDAFPQMINSPAIPISNFTVPFLSIHFFGNGFVGRTKKVALDTEGGTSFAIASVAVMLNDMEEPQTVTVFFIDDEERRQFIIRLGEMFGGSGGVPLCVWGGSEEGALNREGIQAVDSQGEYGPPVRSLAFAISAVRDTPFRKDEDTLFKWITWEQNFWSRKYFAYFVARSRDDAVAFMDHALRETPALTALCVADVLAILEVQVWIDNRNLEDVAAAVVEVNVNENVDNEDVANVNVNDNNNDNENDVGDAGET